MLAGSLLPTTVWVTSAVAVKAAFWIVFWAWEKNFLPPQPDTATGTSKAVAIAAMMTRGKNRLNFRISFLLRTVRP
jgi:hypothetical protein